MRLTAYITVISAAVASAAESSTPPPHLVFVMADDLVSCTVFTNIAMLLQTTFVQLYSNCFSVSRSIFLVFARVHTRALTHFTARSLVNSDIHRRTHARTYTNTHTQTRLSLSLSL